MHSILEKRLILGDQQGELFRSTGCVALLDPYDQEVAHNIVKKLEAEQELTEEFEEELAAARKRLHPHLQRALDAGSTKKKKCGSVVASMRLDSDLVPLFGRRFNPEQEDISGYEARCWCPPGGSVTKDFVASRWWLKQKVGEEHLVRPRSWQSHGGQANALKLVLQFAWQRFLNRSPWSLLDCPIQGLFPERTGDAKKDAEELSKVKVIP